MMKKTAIAALAACAALSLSACTGNASSDSSVSDEEVTVVSAEDIQKEYQESIGKLAWPDNYPPEETVDIDTSVNYELGWGDTLASTAYECAWSKEWLDTYASDEAAATTALQRLEEASGMDYMSEDRADESTRQFFKENLDKAKLGDPSGIQNSVSLNCD